MIFSRACEYGIKATLYISQQSLKGKKVMLKDIAEEIGSPPAFTAKILQDLTRKMLIKSLKGPKGGFYIEKKDLQQFNLIAIVTAIDGNAVFTRCGLGLNQCDESHPCPMHDEYKVLRSGLNKMLQNTNLEELATGLEENRIYLKR